ncbi:MAG: carboxypeptidase regulatory-like domain-containing protein [Bacteroidetes bacterium]|nr:carboxypeptidase regulatory-like domain-containing protein [Bacteroidota bacterium]
MKPLTLTTLFFSLLIFSAFRAVVAAPKISGVVRNSDNSPASFASVLLLNSKDSSLVKGDVTNDKGEYQFDEVEKGDILFPVAF